MSEQPSQDRKLSEISHLFLSSVRQKASNGGAAPRRIPPGERRAEPCELTPEELAQVAGDSEADQEPAPEAEPLAARVLIASHLNGNQRDRVREYARHLTADGSRIGLIEVDASEFRLVHFGSGEPEARPEPRQVETLDATVMAQALETLAPDVDHWLLLLPTPRIPEARSILRAVPHWVMLSTCDHDGVVAAYRTIKGLSDLLPKAAEKPSLALALFDAADQAHAERTSQKLSRACGEFLGWSIDTFTTVQPSAAWEHELLCCQPVHDKSQIATAPQWQIITEFLSGVTSPAPDDLEPIDPKDWARRLTPSPTASAP